MIAVYATLICRGRVLPDVLRAQRRHLKEDRQQACVCFLDRRHGACAARPDDAAVARLRL